jgi:hypothetical protein
VNQFGIWPLSNFVARSILRERERESEEDFPPPPLFGLPNTYFNV